MHNICFVMQGKKLGRDLGEMEAWEHMKLVTPGPNEPWPAPPKYFGKAKENKEKYCEEYAKLHPEVEDPMSEPIDEVAMMLAGSGQPHGRPACLAGGFKPQRNFTQIKATLPSGSYGTSSRTTCRSRAEVDVSHPHLHPLFWLLFLNDYVDEKHYF